MNQPKISVIIPVYNSAADLEKCLESVIHQTYRNLEIILINDGSTDASPEICRQYAAIDDRVVYLSQENKGVSASRNRGIDVATGDYYHFLDSDDYIELDTYQYLVQQMYEDRSEAITFEYFITYKDREMAHQLPLERYGKRDTAGAIHGHMFEGNTFLCTKLLPAKAVNNLRLREDIYRDEDTLFGWQALRVISSVTFSSRPLLHYVQSEESATRGRFRPNQLTAIKVIPLVEEFLSSDYPQWLPKWYRNYMHLMIMLYMDMAMDPDDFFEGQRLVYDTFCSLYRKVGFRGISGLKEKMKFIIFKISPKFFAKMHKRIHRL